MIKNLHCIKKDVKPILEEMGYYNGKDVSSKKVFEKYLGIHPDRIIPLWQFQIIISHELDLWYYKTVYENLKDIRIFSKDYGNNKSTEVAKGVFITSNPDKYYMIKDDKSILESWASNYDRYYDDDEYFYSNLIPLKEQNKKIARYWLKYDKHFSCKNEPAVIRGQQVWDSFIQNYVCWESEKNGKKSRCWL